MGEEGDTGVREAIKTENSRSQYKRAPEREKRNFFEGRLSILLLQGPMQLS